MSGFNDPSELTAFLTDLKKQVDSLTAENQMLMSHLGRATLKEPKVDMPDKFAGKPSELRNFLAQIKNIIDLRPGTYATDRHKTGLVGSLCNHEALNWYRTLQENQSPLLGNFKDFIEDMLLHFGDPNIKDRAKKDLLTLKQGSRPASSYAIRFRRIAADTGFNEETLQYHFESGLNPSVRQAIAVNDKHFQSLDELIKYAIKVDIRLHESVRPNQVSQFHGTNQVNRSASPTPMDLGSVRFKPLSEDEKKRRRQAGLCLYCGTSGHFAQACPSKKSPVRQVRVTTGSGQPKNE